MPLAAPAIFTGARAATPRNIVAMAKQIDDIVGAFDPGESYEFSNNEVCGNLYRKLVIPDPAGGDRLVGDLAEKWEVSKDGPTFTFHISTACCSSPASRLPPRTPPSACSAW